MRYYCTNCGNEFPKWAGRCSFCGEWGTLAEIPEDNSKGSSSRKSKGDRNINKYTLSDLAKTSKKKTERISSGFKEFDRVMGGGIVPGSVTLIAGEPGIGKSTVLLQIALKMSMDKKILYISGEESASQIYSRVERISSKTSYSTSQLIVSDITNLESISDLINEESPAMVVIDSIQAMESETVRSAAGSIGQVRVCGSGITRIAKESDIPIIIIGQITKEGNIAGPKVLEHVVDTVLSFEGGEYNVFRILRSVKNRFGATNEIAVFEMKEAGLEEVENPSKVFLESSGKYAGSALGAVLQGSRVIFVEVQALVVERGMEAGPLRRVSNGIKKPRLDMLCAVLSKRGGVYLGDKDVFVNVVGGLNVDNPTLDLAVCASIKSAVNDTLIDNTSIYWGEVGLTGEIRGSFLADLIVKESKRVGYKKIYMPTKVKELGEIKVNLVSNILKV